MTPSMALSSDGLSTCDGANTLMKNDTTQASAMITLSPVMMVCLVILGFGRSFSSSPSRACCCMSVLGWFRGRRWLLWRCPFDEILGRLVRHADVLILVDVDPGNSLYRVGVFDQKHADRDQERDDRVQPLGRGRPPDILSYNNIE